MTRAIAQDAAQIARSLPHLPQRALRIATADPTLDDLIVVEAKRFEDLLADALAWRRLKADVPVGDDAGQHTARVDAATVASWIEGA